MNSRKITKKAAVFILILILMNSFFLMKYKTVITDPQKLRQFILNYDFDQLVYLTLITIQVIVSMLPGQVFGLVGGFLYGPLLGTVYSMLGVVVGSAVVFLLSREFGRPFMETILRKEKIIKYDRFVCNNGKLSLFLIFLFPALPDDLVCFLAGISKIKFINFIIIVFLGRLPGFLVLSLIGSEIIDQSKKEILMMLFILITMTIIFIKFRDDIEKQLRRLIQKVR
ncbi:MAG: TVP38/TMEM64 family protein [Kosmotoga sp.]|nr:MAG: TVP38/TMEM64 family protein [Kosmotoga sp.]